MTLDVTPLFETYRECARHLRNTCFSTRESQDWLIVEDFEEVARVLFARLVLLRLGGGRDVALESAVENDRILIVPASSALPLMISRDRHGGGYWDHPVTCLEEGDARIAFRDYFDWDQHALVDFRYYHGVILDSERYPDLAGHEVLIETIYARLHLTSNNFIHA